MNLSREAVREYREIYAREFGREISESEATEHAGRLVRLVALLLHDAVDLVDDPQVEL
ncbi:hypothetical protein KF840_07250 [bacterium]|nr:hypothetical protein [bacterium]